MAERKKVQKINPRKSVKRTSGASAVQRDRASIKKEASGSKSKGTEKRKSSAYDNIKMSADVPKQKSKYNSDVTEPVRHSYNKQTKKSPPVTRERVYGSAAAGNKSEKRDFKVVNKKRRPAGTELTVVSGNKLKAQRRRLITALVAFVVIMSVVIFWATSSTGPIERITNSFAIMGSGEFPAAISGTKTLDLETEGDRSFVLTNTHLCAYNSKGKQFLQLQHNFSNPVLETSAERTLIYNLESTGFLVANNSEALYEQNLEQSIYAADISNSGSVAFATNSASYAAQVLVFSKNMEQYFSWYLADGLISDILLSDDGDYLAVSVLKVKDGVFCSEIYCFDTDEKDPLFVKEYKSESVVSLDNISDDNFAYVSNKKVAFIDFESGTEINIGSNSVAPSFFRCDREKIFAVYGENAYSEVITYSKSGEKLGEVSFNGLVDEISVFEDGVYILSGNQISVLNMDGKQVDVISPKQNPTFISGCDGGVLCVDNLHMSFYEVVTEE